MTTNGPITLKEFMEADLGKLRVELSSLRQLIEERDRLYGSQFAGSKTAVDAALAAQEKAVNAAFLASEKAIVKAEDAQKEYNIRSNEFRGQLDDQAKTLMARTETLTMFKASDDKISAMQQNFESKLDAIRLSNEKVFDSTSKELASLRESRSEGTGRGAAGVDQRAGAGEVRAYIGLAFTALVAIIALAGLVVSVSMR